MDSGFLRKDNDVSTTPVQGSEDPGSSDWRTLPKQMTRPVDPATTGRLRDCLSRYQATIPGLATLIGNADTRSPTALVERYEQCYPLLEQALWSGRHGSQPEFDALLDCYQSLFREQEALIRQQAESTGTADERYHFIISIPVADRPAHLRACLESLYQVCERFGYGGQTAGVYTHLQVLIAEDSREADHIREHIALAGEYRRKGLPVAHFGQDEQYALLQTIPATIRDRLGNLLTTLPRDRFCLKGQAANRNLSVLKCLQLTADRDRTLYYFVDSDESFCVNRLTDAGEESVYALNYFHAIDRIFRHTGTRVLTGRMVGDPPVSPAVMAANFLDDVTAFFERLAQLHGDEACAFHGLSGPVAAALSAGAVYHDMASLFGFENRSTPVPYRCPLAGAHDHVACLRTLASRLSAFFFGEHLTRRTVFAYGNGLDAVTPARTVYPGNTIVNHAGLKYVIPFGHLRLRMSGPTAGRLIAAEIHDRFASANLPHLHRRTNAAGLAEAFRPGVELAGNDAQETIDLSREFERQFFGDLMLFTTELLVTEADIHQPFAQDDVARAMDQKEQELLALYQQKHAAILEKNRHLHELVFHAGHWWLEVPGLAGALQQVRAFMDNIQRNFGEQSPAWRQIQSAEHRAERKRQLIQALVNYRTERDAWDSLFA